MSTPRGKNGFRPLGSTRLGLPSDHKTIKISGNAMSTPSVGTYIYKPLSEQTSSHIETPTEFGDSGTKITQLPKNTYKHNETWKNTDTPHEHEILSTLDKEPTHTVGAIQEINRLENLLEEQSVVIRVKEGEMRQMEESLAKQEDYYKELYKNEQTAHGNTRKLLDHTEERLSLVEQQMSRQQEQYERTLHDHVLTSETRLKETREQQEKELEETVERHGKEVAERDEKVARLKSQMADILKDNSWERQKQLSELTKELSRMHDEADELKMELKNKRRANSRCSNCGEIN